MEAYQAGQAVYKDDCAVVGKNYDDAIAALVVAVAGQNVPRGPYSEHVYEAARNVAESLRGCGCSLLSQTDRP